MLGDKIFKLRESTGLTLSNCAKQIGISAGYLSDIEKNIKKNPSIELLGKIAIIFGVTVSELLSNEEKLEMAVGSLNEINKTIEHYYAYKTDEDHPNNGIELDAETHALLHKVGKLSKKDRIIVEVLVDQLLKEE